MSDKANYSEIINSFLLLTLPKKSENLSVRLKLFFDLFDLLCLFQSSSDRLLSLDYRVGIILELSPEQT